MGRKVIVESSSSEVQSDIFNEELATAMSLSLKVDILNVKDALAVVNEKIEKFLQSYYEKKDDEL